MAEHASRRSDAAPRLSREASARHGARIHRPDRPARPAPARRLAPGLTEGAAMADEPRPGRMLDRHRGALLAGQEPRRLWPAADPRGQVGPRTSRPARGLLNGHTQGKAVVAGRAPGSATFRSAPPSVGRVAPPDNGAPLSEVARLWSAGTRAHVSVALRLRGAQLVLEGARSGDNRVIAPCPRGSRPPAPPRPGWTARRARRAWQTPCRAGSTGRTAPASPRRPGAGRRVIRYAPSRPGPKHNAYPAGRRHQSRALP
jgi:hypothetical protein